MIERDDTLSPEEAELSAALARLYPAAVPSPTLDAAILGAARRAVLEGGAAGPPVLHTAPRQVRRRPRARMAAGMGIAASVLLATGLAWQLRPSPGDAVTWSEAPMADAARKQSSPGAVGAQSPGASVVAPPPPSPPSAQDLARMAASDRSAGANVARVATDATDGAADEAGAYRTDAELEATDAAQPQTYARASPAPAPPAPAPPPAPSVLSEPVPMDAPTTATAQPLPAPTATGRAAAPRMQDAAEPPRESGTRAAREIRAADGTRNETRRATAESMVDARARASAQAVFDQPYDDQPPASLDSPDVRRAWLARIVELMESEQYEAARASLAEFQRRYPDDAVPPELAPLQE